MDKIRLYLDRGVKEIWLVKPKMLIVEYFVSSGSGIASQELNLPSPLTGKVSVSEFFAPERRQKWPVRLNTLDPTRQPPSPTTGDVTSFDGRPVCPKTLSPQATLKPPSTGDVTLVRPQHASIPITSTRKPHHEEVTSFDGMASPS